MMKIEKGLPSWFDWIALNLTNGQIIGIDYTQYPALPLETRVKFFEEKKMIVKSISNLVDLVWDNRPDRTSNPVFHLEQKYTGITSVEKFTTVSQSL